jgi:regulatory protein
MSDPAVSLNDLRAYAMNLLARREYAASELQGRLCAKWRGLEGIQALARELVTELENEGALSDQRYVAAFVRSRQQRSQGPIKIRAELRQRQLPAALIDETLQQSSSGWIDLAANWLSRQQGDELGYEDRAKFYRRLVNRGFSHEQAMAALEQHSDRHRT